MTTTPSTRPPLLGVRHVALFVPDLEVAERFWVDVMGYAVEWRPDPDNVYLCAGSDNLALHRAPAVVGGADAGAGGSPTGRQRLDHIGLAVPAPDHVDAWASHLGAHGVSLQSAPRTHRDGSRSLYFHSADGTLVQIIYHRPLSQ
ncbi:MAG: VOC family protein [Pseudomonadota bacterium]